MQDNRETLVEYILSNNPISVSEQLVAMGLLESGEYLSPEDLKTVIHDVASHEMGIQSGSLEAYWDTVADAINVPVDPQGPYAAELLNIQLSNASLPVPASSLQAAVGGWRSVFFDVMIVLAGIAIVLGIVHLIRKF